MAKLENLSEINRIARLIESLSEKVETLKQQRKEINGKACHVTTTFHFSAEGFYSVNLFTPFRVNKMFEEQISEYEEKIKNLKDEFKSL